MSPEERAAALQMLGGGAVRQAGNQLTGRDAQLQQQEAAASGMAPPPAMPMAPGVMGGPAEPQPMQKSPGMLRKLADMLRGAAR